MRFFEALMAGTCGAVVSLFASQGTSLLISTTQDGFAAQASGSDADTETVEGQVVDLYEYLVGAEADIGERGSARWDGAVNFPGPIGLIVMADDEQEEEEEGGEGRARLSIAGDVMRVMVFDPSDEQSRAAYRRLQQMPGQSVTIEAALLERDGVLGCAVRKIQEEDPVPADPVSRERDGGSEGGGA